MNHIIINITWWDIIKALSAIFILFRWVYLEMRNVFMNMLEGR